LITLLRLLSKGIRQGLTYRHSSALAKVIVVLIEHSVQSHTLSVYHDKSWKLGLDLLNELAVNSILPCPLATSLHARAVRWEHPVHIDIMHLSECQKSAEEVNVLTPGAPLAGRRGRVNTRRFIEKISGPRAEEPSSCCGAGRTVPV
jgi:hypothetical protein